MRLQQLDLIKYGKFTGQSLTFPQQERDFHLIVGPNEAGKSTLRRAISELLYGMPLRSEMGFLHPLAELRLGAVIESNETPGRCLRQSEGPAREACPTSAPPRLSCTHPCIQYWLEPRLLSRWIRP